MPLLGFGGLRIAMDRSNDNGVGVGGTATNPGSPLNNSANHGGPIYNNNSSNSNGLDNQVE